MDLEKSLRIVTTFLECELNDSDLPDLINHLNFANFKQNSAVNYEHIRKMSAVKWDHIRLGKIGGNPELTPEITERIEEWTKNQLTDSDLQFPYQRVIT